MSLEIIDCEQGTPEWFAARLGLPTASEFKTILAVKKEAKDKATRRKYMHTLIGEILTGEIVESYTNANMDRGKVMEDEARSLYAMMKDADPVRVGFIRNGQKGASPDSLLDANAGLEIKTAVPHIQIDRILRDELPPEHRAQVQGNLWVAEREWWDFVSYWPKLPLFVKRVYRDESYIAELAKAVDQFNDELQETLATVRRYGMSPAKRSADLADLLAAG